MVVTANKTPINIIPTDAKGYWHVFQLKLEDASRLLHSLEGKLTDATKTCVKEIRIPFDFFFEKNIKAEYGCFVSNHNLPFIDILADTNYVRLVLIPDAQGWDWVTGTKNEATEIDGQNVHQQADGFVNDGVTHQEYPRLGYPPDSGETVHVEPSIPFIQRPRGWEDKVAEENDITPLSAYEITPDRMRERSIVCPKGFFRIYGGKIQPLDQLYNFVTQLFDMADTRHRGKEITESDWYVTRRIAVKASERYPIWCEVPCRACEYLMKLHAMLSHSVE